MKALPDAFIFYTIVAGSFLIQRVPFIGRYLRTLNTLLHESGHALAALLTSGEVMTISIDSDTSGLTKTKSNSRFSAIIVSAAGYPFAAAFSSLLVALAISRQPQLVFFILLSIMLINLALFVRNTYGIFWLVISLIFILILYWKANETVFTYSAIVLSIISLTESVTSGFALIALALKNSSKAGDATNLARLTSIPAAIWSLLLMAFTLWCIYYLFIHHFPTVTNINIQQLFNLK